MRAVHSERIRPPERITLTSLVTDVTGVKIPVHAVLQRNTDKVLHTVGNVSRQEPSIRIGQEVVNGISLGDVSIVLDRVDIVVIGTDAEFGLKQTSSNELECRGHDQFTGLSSDQQTTLIRPCGDLNDGILKRSLVQVGGGCRDVAVGSTRNQGVRSREQGLSIATIIGSGEAIVQNCSGLNLFGVSSGPCYGLHQTS